MNVTQPLWTLHYVFRSCSQIPGEGVGSVVVFGADVIIDEEKKTITKIPDHELEKIKHAIGIAKDTKNVLRPGFNLSVARTLEEIPVSAKNEGQMLMITNLSELNAASYQQLVYKTKPERLSTSSENGTKTIDFAGYKDIGPASVNGTTVRHMQRADLIPEPSGQ